MVHAVLVVYLMNGCRRVELTSGRASSPATDQMWFVNAPTVHPLRCFKTTSVGPMPNFFEPRESSVAVGISRAGPRPQTTRRDSPGERKKLWVVSPRPFRLVAPTTSFWRMIGVTVREIRFHFLFKAKGIDGWRFSV